MKVKSNHIFVGYILISILMWAYTHPKTYYNYNTNSKYYKYITKNKEKYIYDFKHQKSIRVYAENISGIKIPHIFSQDEILLVFNECKKYNIPPEIIFRLISAESSFRKKVTSKAGATGYMQLMPNTYKHFKEIINIKPNDIHSNLKVGIYYLNHLYKKWGGYDNKLRWKMTLLSYNYGITKVKNNISYFQSPEFDSYWYIKKIIG